MKDTIYAHHIAIDRSIENMAIARTTNKSNKITAGHVFPCSQQGRTGGPLLWVVVVGLQSSGRLLQFFRLIALIDHSFPLYSRSMAESFPFINRK
jgi:hypothetical protein